MKRPLLVIAVGYIIGIIWGLYCSCSIALLYAVICLITLLTKLSKHKIKSKNQFKLFSIRRYSRYLRLILKTNIILTISISSFISNSIVIYQNYKYNNLYSNIKDPMINGIIVSNPKQKEKNIIYKVKVKKLDKNDKFKNTHLLVYLSNDSNIKLEYGDNVLISGEFKSPSAQRNYKGFDYKEYLKTQKIYGSFFVQNIKIINKSSYNRVLELSNNIFLKIKNNIQKRMPEENANLILGIMLGYTEEIDEDIVQLFRNSNMAHVLAVSGMHIMIIITIITKTLNKIMGKSKCRIIIIFILIEYMFLTGFTISIVRACMMGIVMTLSRLVYRKNDTWSSTSFSALIILINNPFSITSISFLLSFGGTIGIILFNRILLQLLKKIKIKDKKYKYKIRRYTKIINYIKETLALSISVQITIIPIIVVYFNTSSFSFILTSLLISIIFSSVIFLGFITIISAIFIPKSLKVISIFLIPFIKIIIIISKLGSILPLNKIYINTPNLIEIIIYYMIIFIILLKYKLYNAKIPGAFEYRIRNILSLIRYKIKSNKNKMIISAYLIIIIAVLINLLPHKLKVYFVDVGQGDCTLIVTPKGKKILIDGGGSTNKEFDVGKSILLPYLLNRRSKRIDYVIISHFDQDHIRTDY